MTDVLSRRKKSTSYYLQGSDSTDTLFPLISQLKPCPQHFREVSPPMSLSDTRAPTVQEICFVSSKPHTRGSRLPSLHRCDVSNLTCHERHCQNKADRHKPRALSKQRPTKQPTDQQTKRLIESRARD